MDPSDLLNPLNPLSPLSPLNPLHPIHNTGTETREHQSVPTPGVQVDLTVNWLTWTLLGLVALILAGVIVKRLFKRKRRKPDCLACQHFIPCVPLHRAQTTTCPLLK